MTSENENGLEWNEADILKRNESLLPRAETIFLLIDVQEKLLLSIANREPLLEEIELLLKAAGVLNIPVIVTEQYPQGLGPTVSRLTPHLVSARRVEKRTFSAVGERTFHEVLEEISFSHVVVFGIETHVCVAQTALDLAARGLHVTVPADAVSSRKEEDRSIALERLRTEGIVVSSTEAIIFELLVESGTPEFKEILKLVK